MITNKEINELFNIKESFELPQKLLKMLFDKEEKNKLCENFLKNDIDLSYDIMRDYFQEQHSNRGDLKQDYTPDCICNLLYKLAPKANNMLDVCAGTGAISISFLNSENKQYQLEELSARSIPVLLFNLIIRNVSAIVYQKNVITKEIEHIYKITTSEKFSDIEEITEVQENKQFDLIVSNPPYSLTWEPKQDDRFNGYELPPKSKADYAFVLDILYRLKEQGKAFIILPHGVLFRGASEEKIRKQLIENNVIETIIGLPDKLFLNTGIPVFILVLNKNKKDNNILFINSDKNFKKFSKQNILEDEHINKIIDAYNQRKNIEKFSHLATYEEIKKNDFNLNIPRYVSTFEKEEIRPIEEIMTDLIEAEKEINKTTLEISKMVDELVGTNLEAQKQVEDLKVKYKVLEVFQNTSALDNLCEAINNLEKDLELNHCVLELKELATIERAIKGKVYKKGCMLLQISATNGDFIYLEKDSEVEAKYAVIIPNPDINSKYLYLSIGANLEKYLLKVQQVMNISLEDVYKIPVCYHLNKITQMKFVAILETLEKIEKLAKMNNELNKEEKKFLLENMFC